ncbi:MAG: alginate export family protein [Hyphomonadaceae bacterium]|nr:alginate export family protein [Hyphomonadaceae bacterium]
MRHMMAVAAMAPLWWAGAALAQDGDASGLRVSGSVRLRTESIANAPRAGVSPADDLFGLRTRIFAETDAGGWTVAGELYDSRVFGAEDDAPITTNDVNALELVQLYARRPFEAGGMEGAVQIGRFMINLGSRRLVAADDFRNTTNGYTGVRLDLERGGASLAAIAASPQIRRPDNLDDLRDAAIRVDHESAAQQVFGGVATWASAPNGPSLQGSYFYFVERDRSGSQTRDRRLHTAGLRAFRDPARGAWDHDVEGFRQWGEISVSAALNAPRQDVAAWFLHAEIGRTWDAPWRPRLSVEYDVASGDDPGGDFERFDTLFGMRRAEIAPSGLYNAVGRANLAAPAVRFEAQPSPRWDLMAVWRGLALESRFDAFSTTGARDPSGAAGVDAGEQVELRVRAWLAPDRVRLEGAVVHLDKGPFFARAPNANGSGDTLYSVLDLTYSF